MEADLLLKVCGTLLLALSSYLMKSLIGKLEKGNEILGELKIDMAIIKEQLRSYNTRITSLEHNLKELESQFIDFRNRFHYDTKRVNPQT